MLSAVLYFWTSPPSRPPYDLFWSLHMGKVSGSRVIYDLDGSYGH